VRSSDLVVVFCLLCCVSGSSEVRWKDHTCPPWWAVLAPKASLIFGSCWYVSKLV